MKRSQFISLILLLNFSLSLQAATYEDLTSPNAAVRKKALFDIETLTQEGRDSLLPKLIKELRISPFSKRSFILEALKRLGPFATEAIPAVKDIAINESRNDYSPSIQTLASFGEKAVPALLDIQKRKKKKRKAVFLAIGNMGTTAKKAKATLEKFLENRDPELRFEAARALYRIDPTTQAELTPILIDLLKEAEGHVLIKLAETFGLMGTDAAVAIPSLLPSLKDPIANYSVCIALIKMGPDRKEVKDALLAELSAPREEGGSYGAELALSRYGNDILEDLEKIHEGASRTTKERVEVTLKKIGTEEAFDLIGKFRKEKP